MPISSDSLAGPAAPLTVTLERDPRTGGTRFFLPHDAEDVISIRAVRTAPPHFRRFAQLTTEAPMLTLLELPPAILRVFLALVYRMDRDGAAQSTTLDLAELTGLSRPVVSRALTDLWRRDLIRPTGRDRAGRRWTLTPRLVYAAPAKWSAGIWAQWSQLPAAEAGKE